MFWKKKDGDAKTEKLTGPKDIPELVKKYVLAHNLIDAASLPFLKVLQKRSGAEEKKFDIRIFDPSDAEAREVKVADYNTLSANPEMVIAEGSFNEGTKQVELTVKIEVRQPKLLTAAEIQPQIEALKEPGSSVFYYMAAGPGAGGPLGRGAVVIKANDVKADKKQKKYTVFGARVVNMQPIVSQLKIFDSDKPQQIAKWVSEAQKPRFC